MGLEYETMLKKFKNFFAFFPYILIVSVLIKCYLSVLTVNMKMKAKKIKDSINLISQEKLLYHSLHTFHCDNHSIKGPIIKGPLLWKQHFRLLHLQNYNKGFDFDFRSWKCCWMRKMAKKFIVFFFKKPFLKNPKMSCLE